MNFENEEFIKEEDETLILDTEKGKVKCQIISVFEMEYKGKDIYNYIALLPLVNYMNEILIYKYIQLEEDEIELKDLENDEFEEAKNLLDKIITESINNN